MAEQRPMARARTRLLVVDDSAVVRQAVAQAVARAGDIELVATAADPLFAMEKMRRSWPDVIVLDIEMPRMDGITFLRAMMAERPTPVVICSTLTTSGAPTLALALAAGAFRVVGKPMLGLKDAFSRRIERYHLAAVVRNAAAPTCGAGAQPRRAGGAMAAGGAVAPPCRRVLSARHGAGGADDRPRVAIGTSTGGTQALERC
jgi:two-component system chemotaxis response regulator CheB